MATIPGYSANATVNPTLITNQSAGGETPDTTDSLPPDVLMFEHIEPIVVPVVFGLITIIGLVGNVLVITVVLVNHNMRSTTNVLILNLALSDLLFILICVPFTAMAIAMPTWPFGHYWCRIYQYMINVTVYAGVYTLVLMSFVRYLAIVHPLGVVSRRLRRQRAVTIMIVAIWAVILPANIPILFEYDVVQYPFYDEVRSACFNMKMLSNDKHGVLFYGCFFAFGFALPLAVISVLYGFLLRRLRHGFGHGRGSRDCQSTQDPNSKRRITRMVVIVVVCFAVCWLPIQTITLCIHMGYYPDSQLFMAIQLASNCLAYMNSCVNPLLYAFLSKSFLRSFCHVLCCFSDDVTKTPTVHTTAHTVYLSRSVRSRTPSCVEADD